MSSRLFLMGLSCGSLLGAMTVVQAATLNVPVQYLTIQAALNASSDGDVVEVASGLYLEHDIQMKSGVKLRGATGAPADVVIDAQQLGRVISCVATSSSTQIAYLTLQHGKAVAPYPDGAGGGMYCGNVAATEITRCVFFQNSSSDFGGGLYLTESNPLLRECVFRENSSAYGGAAVVTNASLAIFEDCLFFSNMASVVGGAIDNAWWSDATYVRCTFSSNHGEHGAGAFTAYFSDPTLESCTFVGNSAGTVEHGGAHMICDTGSLPVISKTIFAFGLNREGLLCKAGGVVSLSCVDIFGNEGGDWVGDIANQLGTNGNFSSDPFFCDSADSDFHLWSNSPCLPGQHPDGASCGLVGASDLGCSAVGVEQSWESRSWGKIKGMYR